MTDRLLTTQEAAERLRVKPGSLNTWRSRGGGIEVPFVKVGRAVRYRESDIQAVIAGLPGYLNTIMAD